MKKSNKLLIAFAASLVLIPVLGMVFVSATQYKKGSYTTQIDTAWKDFNHKSENIEAIAIEKAFHAVEFKDAGQLAVTVKYIESQSSGVKIDKRFKDKLKFAVDDQGVLQVQYADANQNQEGSRRYITLFVYGKALNQVTVNKAAFLEVSGSTDSLSIYANELRNVNISGDLKANSLSVYASNVKDISTNDTQIRTLTLQLKESNFNSYKSNFEELKIDATGVSDIELNGETQNPNFIIKSLNVNTHGKSKFRMADITVTQASGRFSNETQIEMPAINLNQMYLSVK